MAMLAFVAFTFMSFSHDDSSAKETVFIFDGKEYKIESAAIYHNSEDKGYNIVLADSKSVELQYELLAEPVASLSFVTIDYPDSQMGTMVTEVNNHGDENWEYYLGVRIKGENAYAYFEASPISISRYVDFADGVLTVKINAKSTAADGTEHTLCVNYKGNPAIVDEYIK